MRSSIPYKVLISVIGVIAILFGLTGCGGGGGGGGSPGGGGGGNTTVTGTVFSVETGVPPVPGASVNIAGNTATTGVNGTFTLNVAASAASAVISENAGSSGQPEVTLTIPLKLVSGATNNLGSIYLSDTGYTASASGTVVTIAVGKITPVGGAAVTINGETTTTATDGTFTLNGLPVGLGTTAGDFGMITATGFSTKLITADVLQFALIAGANPLGQIPISPPSGSAPLPPATISGTVDVNGVPAANVSVTLSQNGNVVGVLATATNGAYSFWVVPGAYTVTAGVNGTTASANVTLASAATPITVPVLKLTQ